MAGFMAFTLSHMCAEVTEDELARHTYIARMGEIEKYIQNFRSNPCREENLKNVEVGLGHNY